MDNMTESNDINSPLNEGQAEVLQKARELKPTEPPRPWGNRKIISASGVLAAGWDKSGNILLVSTDGYSLTNPDIGERISRNEDRERTYAAISSSNLRFQNPETEEPIDIFGVNGGDGIHRTQDGWTLKKIYPWWPREDVIIKSPFILGSGRYHLLDDAYLIKLIRLDGWLKCGFSPSGKHFAIIGSGGAEVFSR